MSRRHGSVLNVHMPMIRWHTASLCGHCIQDETDEDALDYNIIGVWLVCHRKYRDWSTEKSYDLAWILEFMQAYHMTIPRYIKRTKFYRKKMKILLSSLVRDKDQS